MTTKNDQEKNREDFLLVSTGIPLSAAEKKSISDVLQKTFMSELAKIDHSSHLIPDTLASLPRARGGVGDDFFTIGKGTAGVTIRKQLKTMNSVLIVGIENYAGLAETLPGCVNDARSWETLLKSRYKVEDITVLLNDKADRKSVSDALASLFKKHTEQSPAIFIYAGHGDRIKHGSSTEDVLVFRSDDGSFSGGDFSDDNLTDLLKENLQKAVKRPPVLVLDCCYSGGLIEKRRDSTARSRSLSDPRSRTGVERSLDHKSFGYGMKAIMSQESVPQILAGAGPDQSAWDAKMKDGKRHGLFSFVATNALFNDISLSYEGLISQVKATIAKDYDFGQSPELSGNLEYKASSFSK